MSPCQRARFGRPLGARSLPSSRFGFPISVFCQALDALQVRRPSTSSTLEKPRQLTQLETLLAPFRSQQSRFQKWKSKEKQEAGENQVSKPEVSKHFPIRLLKF